ncbi:MAG: hypothetical protein SCAL_000985 [Candidatus Syntrophoarchaeum caldarius]|uniref:Uncharacterized protein n=1 Tax=Candidatus Syntropharchaeum caldarium TaxID=1838285 RepID=A0A1F2P8E9_9EURY|nr:MAG: hypothetical protein SCAL_000985 [Candidatus Syntrophoarchaeum caldarius]
MLKFDGENWYCPTCEPARHKKVLDRERRRKRMHEKRTYAEARPRIFVRRDENKRVDIFLYCEPKISGSEYRKCCEILEECGFKHEKNQKEKWHKDGVPPFKLLEKLKECNMKIYDDDAKINIAYADNKEGVKVYLFDPRIWLPPDKYKKYCEILRKQGFEQRTVSTDTSYGRKEIWYRSDRSVLYDLIDDLKRRGINVLLRGEEV